ncbi:MAG: hypothetical protein R3F59_23210 [Myxococcota bacterium]
MDAPDDPEHRWLRRLRAASRLLPALDDRVWTELLVAYLDGRAKAAHILGDYLEGEGLPRVRPGDVDQRLRYAIGLLPPLLAHAVACDFVEHVAGEQLSVRALLDTKRRWLAGELPDSALKAARLEAQRDLVFRVAGLEAAIQAAAHSPSPSVAARAAAEAARARVSGPIRPAGFAVATQDPVRDEVRWQLGHLRARILAR